MYIANTVLNSNIGCNLPCEDNKRPQIEWGELTSHPSPLHFHDQPVESTVPQ